MRASGYALAAALLIAGRAAAQEALPPGAGHDTMVRVCSGCHDPGLAAQQRLSPDGWRDLVDTMAARGAAGSDADFVEITAYLAKSFPDTARTTTAAAPAPAPHR